MRAQLPFGHCWRHWLDAKVCYVCRNMLEYCPCGVGKRILVCEPFGSFSVLYREHEFSLNIARQFMERRYDPETPND